jgi:CRISPR/Cas system-associated protein endoribonuclease Cas2
MKYLRTLCVAVVASCAAVVIFAGVGTASASVFCTVQESTCPTASKWAAGTVLNFSLKSGTSANLVTTGGETLDTCTESTVKGTIEKAGSNTEQVTGSIGTLTWGKCTFTTTTLLPGKLEVSNITGTHNGTVKGDSETRVTINNGFFGSCVYGAIAGTDLGELKEGKPATFVANAVVIRLSGSAVACPETAKWTAEYTLTEPTEKTLAVEPKEGETPPPTGKSVFCTVQTSPCPTANLWATGTALNFSLKSGTSASLTTTTGEALDTCTESTVKGKIETNEPVKGPIESLTWGKCTFPTTTLLLGRLEVENISGTHNGKVKGASETKVTINGGFFGSCNYGAVAGTNLGEIKEGNPATFVANAVVTKLAGSAVACPETAKWVAEYTLTEPFGKTLSVEAGSVKDSVFCTSQETPCPAANKWATGTALNFSLKSGTSASLTTTTGEALDTCTESTVKGKIETNEPVKGPIESLVWAKCTFPTTTLVLGKLEVKQIKSSHNGTVLGASETRVTINGGFFGSCNYGAVAGTELGTLLEGKPATFFANAVVKKLTGSAVACPETAKWVAEYTLTEPKEKTLSVELG